MASAIASAAPHQIPPIPIAAVPRVRPPRFLKGQPRPDINAPRPEGPAPGSQIWVQGRWRNPQSKAANQHRKVRAQQVRKAVRHLNHGQNIYAYYHMKTRQVVYSLTREMQEGQIFPQLVFHGKKTVPAEIRPDVWRPYFSIHFPENDSGSRAGLKAFQRLREISMRRQLSPPEAMLRVTSQDIRLARVEKGSPVTLQRLKDEGKLRLPQVGQILPKTWRAKKLMDQKASSVADLSYVLRLVDLGPLPQKKIRKLGQSAKRRMRFIRADEAKKEAQIKERQQPWATVDTKGGKVPVQIFLLKQEQRKQEAQNQSKMFKRIKVLWADPRDGTYAEQWPHNVSHGLLQTAYEGRVHVAAVAETKSYAEKVSKNHERDKASWERRREEVERLERKQEKKEMPLLRKELVLPRSELRELTLLREQVENGEMLSDAEKARLSSLGRREEEIHTVLAKLVEIENKFPTICAALDRVEYLEEMIQEYTTRDQRLREQMNHELDLADEKMTELFEKDRVEQSRRVEENRRDLKQGSLNNVVEAHKALVGARTKPDRIDTDHPSEERRLRQGLQQREEKSDAAVAGATEAMDVARGRQNTMMDYTARKAQYEATVREKFAAKRRALERQYGPIPQMALERVTAGGALDKEVHLDKDMVTRIEKRRARGHNTDMRERILADGDFTVPGTPLRPKVGEQEDIHLSDKSLNAEDRAKEGGVVHEYEKPRGAIWERLKFWKW